MLYYLVLFVLLQTTLGAEDDFNYILHGSDWTKGCKTGTKQSPIVLKHDVDPADSYLFGAYEPVTADITFYDTTTYLQTTFGQLFTRTINGKATPFKASNIRLRCKSEHVIHFKDDENYTRFPLQLQIFHSLIEPQSTNDRVAIAIHYEIGETADPIIQKLIDAEVNKGETAEIDLSYYIKRGNTYNYWIYLGSPTIPSCSDGALNWIIIDKRFSISQQQFNYFEKQFYGIKQPDGNYREIRTNSGKLQYFTFGAN